MIVTQGLQGSETMMAWKVARRVMSTLVWIHGEPIQEFLNARMGNHAVEVGDQEATQFHVLPVAVLNTLQQSDGQTKKMLALYREALDQRNPFYRFLGFFKVLNAALSNKKSQLDWTRAALASQTSDVVIKARAKISKHLGNRDESDYLYERCRCAIAHAHSPKEADPDDPEEEIRIKDSTSLMRILAEQMLVSRLPGGGAVGVWNQSNGAAPKTLRF
jgi:hypothetical protein